LVKVPVAINVPVLVVGHGPAPLTVAKMLSGCGVLCLLAGHAVLPRSSPAALGSSAMDVLREHGFLDILHPYLDRYGTSMTISPGTYENVVKRHCVADVNVIVYDEVEIIDRLVGVSGVEAVMTDGRSGWKVRASELVDGSDLPTSLPDAIVAAADLVNRLLRPDFGAGCR
jgi:hypothetical protein